MGKKKRKAIKHGSMPRQMTMRFCKRGRTFVYESKMFLIIEDDYQVVTKGRKV